MPEIIQKYAVFYGKGNNFLQGKDIFMNEATKQLFALASCTRECFDETHPFVYDKIKKLIEAEADINARNEAGFNILQIILQVESPDLPLSSTIINDVGYERGSAWYVEGCLRNGFKCSQEELNDLLSVYRAFNDYILEYSNGDIHLICTLLSMGADWNCKNTNIEYKSLLEVIATSEISYFSEAPEVTDWRYMMLCAYYNAGGDLYVKNKNDKYIWEVTLPLTALAFFLEHNVDIPAQHVEASLNYAIASVNEIATQHILEIDIYQSYGDDYPNESTRYKSIMNLLLDNVEKYPAIPVILAKIIPGMYTIYATHFAAADFYDSVQIYLQTVKEKYGNLQKAADGIIAAVVEKNDIDDIVVFFKFISEYCPECEKCFPWKILNGEHWKKLLQEFPQYAEHCDLAICVDQFDKVYMYIKYRQYANEHWDRAIDRDDLCVILDESSNADFLITISLSAVWIHWIGACFYLIIHNLPISVTNGMNLAMMSGRIY